MGMSQKPLVVVKKVTEGMYVILQFNGNKCQLLLDYKTGARKDFATFAKASDYRWFIGKNEASSFRWSPVYDKEYLYNCMNERIHRDLINALKYEATHQSGATA